MPARDFAPTEYADVDVTKAECFTIDGLIALHAWHGPAVRAHISSEQRAYADAQFNCRREEINTFRISSKGTQWRSLLLVDAEPQQ